MVHKLLKENQKTDKRINKNTKSVLLEVAKCFFRRLVLFMLHKYGVFSIVTLLNLSTIPFSDSYFTLEIIRNYSCIVLCKFSVRVSMGTVGIVRYKF